MRDNNRSLKILDLSFSMKTPGAETKEEGRYFSDPIGTEGY